MSLNTGFKPFITVDWAMLGYYITATQYTNDINPIRSSQQKKVQHRVSRALHLTLVHAAAEQRDNE